MSNDGQKPQLIVPRSGWSNGFIPSSIRTISNCLRIVSSGASNVASTVRSASESVASSIVDREGDASRDQESKLELRGVRLICYIDLPRMYKICHFGGVELKKLDSGEEDKEKRKKQNLSRLDGEDPVRSCKFCSEKSGKECSMPNDLSPHATPLISPTISASSTDSFFSSYSEFLFKANLHGREEGDESGLESLDRPGTITWKILRTIIITGMYIALIKAHYKRCK